ncbi:MAG: tetratricopeptide repeat protein [Phycisphaerales bacterium]|nr:tetratricopeptide repeat protein [Phycisphaerales bacterium]
MGRHDTMTGTLRIPTPTNHADRTDVHYRKWKRLLGLGLAITGVSTVVLVTHLPVLQAGALCFDDPQFLTNNRLVQTPSWASAWRFLTEVLEPSTVDGYYLPLSMVSLMLDYARAGRVDQLTPFHATSLALHIANACLIVLLLYQLLRCAWPAAFAGILFGVHPLTVEPVAWVGERKTVLAAFFALVCFNVYLRYVRTRSRKTYALTIVLFLFALLSKPTTTPLPLLLLLLDYWLLNRLNRTALLEKLPHFILAAVSSIVTLISHQRTAGLEMPTQRGFVDTAYLVCHNFVFLLRKIAWPTELSSHYPFPEPLTLANTPVLVGIVGTALLTMIVILSLRRTRSVATGVAFFLVAVLPTLGIVGFALTPISDKYVYLPAVGLLTLLTAWLTRLWNVSNPESRWNSRRAAVVATVAVAAVLLSVATRRQIGHWRDSESWARRMIELSPTASRPRLHLGIALVGKGRISEAVEQFREILKRDPDYYQAYDNLGMAYGRQGRFDDAVEQYRIALQLHPEWAFNHQNLANFLCHLDRFDEAVEHYREALRITPHDASLHFDLGNAYVRMNRSDDALPAYQEAVRLDPTLAGPHAKLGSLHMRAGQYRRAEEEYRRAVDLEPNNAETNNNLGFALARLGHVDQAVQAYTRAIRLNPKLATAYVNLGDAFRSAQQWADAANAYAHGVRLDPENLDLRVAFAEMLLAGDRRDDAVAELHAVLRVDPQHSRALAILATPAARPRNASSPP